MNRSAWLVVVAIVMGTALCHANPPSRHHRGAVINLLVSKKGFPTAKQMLRTGKATATVRILTALVNDKTKNLVVRLNALRALEYFPTREAEKFLGSVIYGRYRPVMYKSTAMRASARAFGNRVYSELLPFLRDSNVQLREGAALALGEIDDPRVEGNLRNHLTHEQDLSVRVAIEKSLKALRERERKRALRRAKEREVKTSR